MSFVSSLFSKKPKQPMVPFEISVHELKEWRDQKHEHVLIDVREPAEYHAASIGGVLVPMSELPSYLNKLDEESDIVVICHFGGRSAMATEFLRRNGFERARNLKGGINAWSTKIDPSVPQY